MLTLEAQTNAEETGPRLRARNSDDQFLTLRHRSC